MMDKAWQYARRLLTQRPYSKSRLLFKLQQKGYEVEAAQVVARLEAEGAVDDVRFAQMFVEQSQLQRPSGRRRVILALRRRGIDQKTAEAAWQEWEEGVALTAGRERVEGGRVEGLGSVAAALQAAQSRLVRGDLDLQCWADRQRLLHFLNRRGFVYTEAKAALTHLTHHERTERTTGPSSGSD